MGRNLTLGASCCYSRRGVPSDVSVHLADGAARWHLSLCSKQMKEVVEEYSEAMGKMIAQTDSEKGDSNKEVGLDCLSLPTPFRAASLEATGYLLTLHVTSFCHRRPAASCYGAAR